MTRLLKHSVAVDQVSGGPAVRSLTVPAGLVSPRLPEAAPPAMPAEDPAVQALRRQVASLTQQVLELQAELETASHTAYEDGRQAALAVSKREDDAALAQLASALSSSQQEVTSALGNCQRLAVALAQTALAKIFGDMPEGPDVVETLLRIQLARLRPEMVMAVTVSALDFQDEQALAALGGRLGAPALHLRRDNHMPRGACRIELRLGHLDAGLSTQWQKLLAFCETLAAEPGAA